MNEVQLPHPEHPMTVRRSIRPHRVGIRPTVNACLWLVFAGCGGESAAPVAPSAPDTVVTSIRITPSERTIGLLGTRFGTGAAALAADGTTLYHTGHDPGRFAWLSSAPEIASVSGNSNGGSARLVTGLSDGTATITATSQGVTGRLTVTVRERARVAWSVPLDWSFSRREQGRIDRRRRRHRSRWHDLRRVE